MMRKGIVLCLLLLLAAGCAGAEEAGRVLVAENERLALYLSADCCGIEVEDRQTGVTWSSSMNDPTFDGKLVGLNEKKANSLLTVNMTNLDKGAGAITNAVLLNDKALSASYTLVENGACLHYDLGANKIALDVEVLLEGSEVVVRVPQDSIRAYGDFSVVSIDMMPYLCSGSDRADGFLFYPDGCGAIMAFQDNAHFCENTRVFNIYGNMERASGLLDFFDQEEPQVLMPVYGISIDGHSLLVVVEEGAETARISVNCSNKIVALNNVFANFQYRRGFNDLRVTTRQIKTYDREAMDTDYALRLMFLPEGQDGYSAMAVAYRDYLLNEQGLERRMVEQALAIDLFMTAPEKGLLFDTQRTVTTLSQASEVLDAMDAAGVAGALVSLKGWARGGYGMTPDRLPVERAVGSSRELSALAEKAAGMDSVLCLTANFVEANADGGGYSKRNDVVYLSNYAILTDAEQQLFILSPEVIYQKFTAFRSAAEGLGIGGLRLERIGQYIANNYNSPRYCTTAEGLAYYKRMLTEAQEAFGHVSAQGGALWLAPYVELMTEIPHQDSGFQFTTTSVPFYQMVMHGVRAYTGVAGNLSSDLEREVLRWVEMGYMPCFELTYGGTEALMYTNYQNLFTAQYTAWLDELAEISQAFTEGDLWALRTALMMEHTRIASDVVRVRYDNGMTVYVNYSDQPVAVDGQRIPAMDYLVVKGGNP